MVYLFCIDFYIAQEETKKDSNAKTLTSFFFFFLFFFLFSFLSFLDKKQ